MFDVLQDMLDGSDNKTIRWKWIEAMELPRLVHVRVSPIITKTNMYGQITVRIHGRQVRFRVETRPY